MAKKSNKAGSTNAPESEGTLASANASPEITQSIEDALGAIAGVKEKRAALGSLISGVEKLKANLHAAEEVYEAALANVEEAEANLIAKYPSAAAILGQGTKSKRSGRPKGTKAKAKKSNTLSAEQAAEVLSALPATFQLGEFKSKSAELFPDLSGKGAMKLLADKVKEIGGAGMGRKYKKV